MSDRVGFLIAGVIVALVAVVVVEGFHGIREGRFQAVTVKGFVIRMDTVTGEAWWSAAGVTPWERIEGPQNPSGATLGRALRVEDLFGDQNKEKGEQ